MIRAVPLVAVLAVACGSGGQPTATATATTAPETAMPNETPEPTPTATQVPARRAVATGLRVPWGIAFLPDGDGLVAERDTGRIKRIPAGGGRVRTVMRVPGVNTSAGEGGLLGLAVSPRYSRDRLVYAYFTSSSDNRIVRFRLGGRVRTVLTGLRAAGIHNGGRIAFGPDGKLYVGVGDAGNPSLAQNRNSLNGKILRMNPNGSVPSGQSSRVWSLGHRNVQGLAWDRRGRLWASEFGQNARDEVNLIRRGRNYGWPLVEGFGPTGGRFTNPKVTWSTSEASPSGAAIIGSNLYVAALRGQCVWRIPLRGASVGKPRRMLAGRYGRIRTVVAAPDGTLWVATSNRDGRGSPRSGDDRIVAVRVARR
ncbi:MAG TPA: PQQ-dependent sugar dehydrogenase [Solirubrobacter sp.]|nr:PQQ-dependent sugar dehydrogenase [Solirubrobacter sp.]